MAGDSPIKFALKGLKPMVDVIKDYAKKHPDKVAAALFQEAQIEMTEAKKRTPVSPTKAQYAAMGRTPPKDHVPGTLRASGMVSEPLRIGRQIRVVLSFGGAAKDYAIVQHERLDFFHTTGQAKYLQSVLDESRPYMAARLASRMQGSGKE